MQNDQREATRWSFYENAIINLAYSAHKLLVLFGDGAQNTAGIAHCHHVIGDIVSHHAAGADNNVAANGHTGHYHAVAAEPNVVSHGDGGPCGWDDGQYRIRS